MDLHVAIWVHQHLIFCVVTTAFRSPYDVMAVPAGDFSDLLFAYWTDAILGAPQVEELVLAPKVIFHLHFEAAFKVHFPSGIVRIGFASDFPVTPDRRAGR